VNAPAVLARRVATLVRAIEENDEASIERAVLRLSGSHRALAPLAFAVSAFVLLFDGLRLVVTHWRLMLVQILPAMWIWLAMLDLKAHVLHDRTFHVIRGPILIPIGLVVVGLTVAAFLLNALFAFAVTQGRTPSLSVAAVQVRAHRAQIVAAGAIVGAALAFATLVVPRWGRPWFGLILSAVAGVMMLCYVAVPARLIGVKPAQSRREKLSTSLVGGLLGATVCTPPYLLGRVGILMLGSKALLIPGVFLIAIGVTLQAGATGAVRAIKMSASLTARPAAASPSNQADQKPERQPIEERQVAPHGKPG
jgi:hypothetical protein